MTASIATFAIAVDLVVLTVHRDTLSVLLVKRAGEPFAGVAALPGTFVGVDEDLDRAAARELVDELGLVRGEGHLEQLASYGDPARDPRGRVVAVAYLALLPGLSAPSGASWHPVAPKERALAFDHDRILDDGVERARAKLEYSSLAAEFCPPEFTIAQLRRIYEAVWGATVDPRNFHRKVTGTPGFVTATDRYTDGDRGRPARLYTKGPATSLHPPLLRR
ncbi:MAG TPA: NUDIX domain-containing protein [Stackebrandtia sp.]|jgi:8-oxo-dGTP diphosphatase|uniref:NUDIX hydrolase n=1 Tax=Stackebrandtia sp. TaxID=2023065 RepID=UPI002D3CA744|nr:NUDIX domain-containing protein [Stackebrandtia sp.]HZE41064.1 NUDIX domain-containing protein [Stackebrandtia sp.]